MAQVKWRTLEHAGVLFPPEYEPHGVRMLYDRVPVDLTPEEEEVATFFAVMKDTGALLCCVGGRRFCVVGGGGRWPVVAEGQAACAAVLRRDALSSAVA